MTKNLLKILGPLLAIAISSCFSVPVAQQAMRVDSPETRSTQSPFCDAVRAPTEHEANRETGLDPEGFRVLTWNVHKGDGLGWLTDLAGFGADHDLVLIQEARLSDPLRGVLRERDLHWALAGAFRFRDVDMGVLTAARAPVDLACMLRAMEPLTRVPKAVVVTRHPFAGSSTSLLVANVHAVNFTLGTSRLRAQLDAVAAILARHDGTGDPGGRFQHVEHGTPSRRRRGSAATGPPSGFARARPAITLSRRTSRSSVLPGAGPQRGDVDTCD